MTKRIRRRLTPAQSRESAPSPRPDEFPALINFVKGYLHEDLAAVHGSVQAAVAAFCAEADPEERRQLADQLDALVRMAGRWPVRDLRRFLSRDLGSRWEPASREELVDLLNRIRATDR